MNDGEKINLVDHTDQGSNIITMFFLIALIFSIGAVHYRVYVKHTINFFLTEEEINHAQPLGSLYGN